jgi:hypothetical protein
VAAHQLEDGLVIRDVELHRAHLRADALGERAGARAVDVRDGHFLDVGLGGEIVNGTEAHAAGAEDEDLQWGATPFRDFS